MITPTAHRYRCPTCDRAYPYRDTVCAAHHPPALVIPTALDSPTEVVEALRLYPGVDAEFDDNPPIDPCEDDHDHGPAVVHLTILGDITSHHAVCGRCALALVAPLPATDAVVAEVYDGSTP